MLKKMTTMQKSASLIGIIVLVVGIYLFMNLQNSTSKDSPKAKIKDIEVTEIAAITGQDSMNKTEEQYDIAGTDLGSIFDMDGTFYYVFGDTFGSGSAVPPGTGPSTNWRSNTVGFSKDMDPTDGIELDGFLADENGMAKELIPSKKTQGYHLTSIPTYGVAVDGSMYLYYMAVDAWGDPGVWVTSYSGVYKSNDAGETWAPVEELTWEGDSNFTQVAIVKPEQNEVLGDDIYFYGVKAGRYSPIQLMKVNKDKIEDKNSYQYFTGTDANGHPQWSSEEKEAKSILETTAGELSVVWNSDLERWIMTYINGETTNIDFVEAENPWGPWTEPKVMVAQKDFPGLYGSYMHPSFIKNEGKTMYFTMSRWGTYNSYMMKAELELE
ncbi:DUF4185 domain-containing protein [Robertmurraya yapensis]|uniref:DUF4185 domain-containing protein n=2 Tax=Bacillaceae TaxID=186817 RepID=A0A431WKI0_9BACI|nr:DUF4185 domain-containing protein [Bacillus yapensis]RTR36102.1 DUF4185 domain-containing protein [Bacillus yapensis]TKT05605.1 DUF4185 domain-containing protein [Bacillus yapensis]